MTDKKNNQKEKSKLADYKLKTFTAQLGDRRSANVVHQIFKSVGSK